MSEPNQEDLTRFLREQARALRAQSRAAEQEEESSARKPKKSGRQNGVSDAPRRPRKLGRLWRRAGRPKNKNESAAAQRRRYR